MCQIEGAAVLTFASGVQRFTRSPALYGRWNWDTIVTVSGTEEGAGQLDAVADALRSSDAAANAAMVTLSDVALDGQVVVTAAFEPVKGELVPTVAAGRLPGEAGEVALGARTMRALGVTVGDTVTTADESELHVVGRVVLPGLANYPGADKTAVGEGAVVSPETLRALGPAFVPIGFAVELARWATIADLQADRPDLGANVLIDALPASAATSNTRRSPRTIQDGDQQQVDRRFG